MIHCMPWYICVRDVTMIIKTYFSSFDNQSILLDPIPMAAVVGLTLAILIVFLVLVIALLIAYKKEKMCFKSK